MKRAFSPLLKPLLIAAIAFSAASGYAQDKAPATPAKVDPAKGGTLFALCKELKLPIRFIGVGEKREDLREFDPEDFVDALLPDEVVEGTA